jgi:threonine/homoserine/homoserine lactone efflux protein
VSNLVGFVVLTLALSATPGPDDVLVLRFSVGCGRRCGSAAAAGAAVGSLAWGTVTAVGLAAALARSDAAFGLVRSAGGIYLVALGLVGIVAQVRGRRRPILDGGRGVPAAVPRSGSLRGAFAAGCLSDVLNPKIGLFYVAVLPQFIPPGAPVLGWSVVLCAIDVTVALGWLLFVARLADAALGWLRRPRVETWFEGLLSASLIGIGAAVSLGL